MGPQCKEHTRKARAEKTKGSTARPRHLKENIMNKYKFGRITFGTILIVVMFSIGFNIKTWQFWVVYGCAWMMAFMTYLEDFSG